MSIDVPKFFKFKELIVTNTGLLNVPDNWETIMNLFSTGKYLDCLRTLYGRPIKVDCGYRSPAVNKAVGGVPTSAHLAGLAADIRPADGTESSNRRLYAVVKDQMEELGVDQLIMYNVTPGNTKSSIRFLHVGFRAAGEMPRNQLLFK